MAVCLLVTFRDSWKDIRKLTAGKCGSIPIRYLCLAACLAFGSPFVLGWIWPEFALDLFLAAFFFVGTAILVFAIRSAGHVLVGDPQSWRLRKIRRGWESDVQFDFLNQGQAGEQGGEPRN